MRRSKYWLCSAMGKILLFSWLLADYAFASFLCTEAWSLAGFADVFPCYLPLHLHTPHAISENYYFIWITSIHCVLAVSSALWMAQDHITCSPGAYDWVRFKTHVLSISQEKRQEPGQGMLCKSRAPSVSEQSLMPTAAVLMLHWTPLEKSW